MSSVKTKETAIEKRSGALPRWGAYVLAAGLAVGAAAYANSVIDRRIGSVTSRLDKQLEQLKNEQANVTSKELALDIKAVKLSSQIYVAETTPDNKRQLDNNVANLRKTLKEAKQHINSADTAKDLEGYSILLEGVDNGDALIKIVSELEGTLEKMKGLDDTERKLKLEIDKAKREMRQKRGS